MKDVKVQNEGTLFLFWLYTPAAYEWVIEHVNNPLWWMEDRALVVEHRYARELAAGMRTEGLEVE